MTDKKNSLRVVVDGLNIRNKDCEGVRWAVVRDKEGRSRIVNLYDRGSSQSPVGVHWHKDSRTTWAPGFNVGLDLHIDFVKSDPFDDEVSMRVLRGGLGVVTEDDLLRVTPELRENILDLKEINRWMNLPSTRR